MTVSSEIEEKGDLMSISAGTLSILFWKRYNYGSIKYGFFLGDAFSTVSEILFPNTLDIARTKKI